MQTVRILGLNCWLFLDLSEGLSNQRNVAAALIKAILPVSGGMSASVTISPSSMVVSEATWSLCGKMGAVWHGVMPSVDVRVLLGISSACSMSSCFMISSASIAWPGESEPGVAEHKLRGEI